MISVNLKLIILVFVLYFFKRRIFFLNKNRLFFKSYFILILFIKANPNGFAHELMKNIKANYHAKQSEGACRQDSDCNNNNFFCKNNDCIAKRPEGSLCLSTKNEECQCGRCQLDPKTWDSMCLSFSLDGECENNGIISFLFFFNLKS